LNYLFYILPICRKTNKCIELSNSHIDIEGDYKENRLKNVTHVQFSLKGLPERNPK